MAPPPAGRRRPAESTREGGAALLVLLLIILGLGSYFLLRGVNQGPGGPASGRRADLALAQAKAALTGFAATYRDFHANQVFGYLPCPDTDNDGVAELNCGAAGLTMIGRLPYKTLDLPDLRDDGGECLWYIVSGSHKYNPKTTPMNWDTRGQIRIVDTQGAQLADPADDGGGAVAVIIAPGPPLTGQDRPSGAGRCGGDPGNAIAAFLDGGYAAATGGTLTVVAGQPGSTSNNDRLAWVTARELFVPIARRADLLGALPGDLFNCLNLTTAAHIPTNNKVAAGTKWVADAAGIDELIATLKPPGPVPACALSAASALAWTNWQDHIRYAVCANPATACLQVGAASCSGVILFGGRSTNARPRTVAERALPGSYFDPVNVAALGSATTDFAGAASYTGATPEADLALCLQPSP